MPHMMALSISMAERPIEGGWLLGASTRDTLRSSPSDGVRHFHTTGYLQVRVCLVTERAFS